MEKHLIDILPDVEMCPMFKTLVLEKFKEVHDDGYERRYPFLGKGVIENYILENIKFRTILTGVENANFVFGIEFVTQFPEHLPKIIEGIVPMIPEPNKIVYSRKKLGVYGHYVGKEIFIGQRPLWDNSPLVESGLILEYIGIYEDSFVLVVYNKDRFQMGYTLLNI